MYVCVYVFMYVFVIYLLPEEISSGADVSFFNLEKVSTLNGATNLFDVKLDTSYASYTSIPGLDASHALNISLISMKLIQQSYVYTHQNSY